MTTVERFLKATIRNCNAALNELTDHSKQTGPKHSSHVNAAESFTATAYSCVEHAMKALRADVHIMCFPEGQL